MVEGLLFVFNALPGGDGTWPPSLTFAPTHALLDVRTWPCLREVIMDASPLSAPLTRAVHLVITHLGSYLLTAEVTLSTQPLASVSD